LAVPTRPGWVPAAATLVALAGIALALGLLPSAFSENDGIRGRAQEGCTCHGNYSSPDVTSILDGVPVNYEPGAIYPLAINETGGPAPAAGVAQGGFGLQVSAGTLAAPDGRVSVAGREASHTVEGNRARGWTVLWTAPQADAGRVTFWLSTNAVNGDNTTKKDLWGQVVYYSDPPGVPPPVNHAPLILAVEGPAEALVGYPNSFVANASDPDGDSLRFTWSFADGTAPQVGRRVNHVFRSTGTFEGTLTAEDTRGLNSSASFTVVVSEPAEPLPPTTIEFTHTFTDGTVRLGAAVEFLCRVRNVGDFAVTSVVVHLHNLTGHDAIATHRTIPLLAPNQTKEVRLTWTPPSAGTYELLMTGRGAEALGLDSDLVLIEVVAAGIPSLDTQIGLASFLAVAAVAAVALRGRD